MKYFDAHVHCSMKNSVEKSIEYYKQICEWNETEKMSILSLPHDSDGKISFSQNIKTLFYKLYFTPNAYAFAGLEHPLKVIDKGDLSNWFLRQAQEYYMVGYDGMKMLEGYPSLRKEMDLSLCDSVYDAYYSFLEEKRIPIVMHIANPTENWGKYASKFAKKAGRVYDGTYPSKEQLYQEVEGIMKKHPKLRLTLAHFGFWSDNIAKAERFLGDYEYTMLDTTPGGEQFLHLAEGWSEWELFFEKYRDRILYGTDTYNHFLENREEWKKSVTSRPNLVKDFFCSNDEHSYLGDPNFTYKGRRLRKGITDKIFYQNAITQYGKPRTISLKYMSEKIMQLKKYYKDDKFEMQDLLFIENYIKGL